MLGAKVWGGTGTAALILLEIATTPVRAETMERALLRAYQNNPQQIGRAHV